MIFTKNNPPTGFYVYLYLREDGTPYYCGKGKGIRAWEQHRDIKNNRGIWTPVDWSRIIIVSWDLLEMGSFILERKIIKWYGRKDLGTGILRNKTDGGEGVTGLIHSIEQKAKSKATKIKNGTLNNPHQPAARQKARATMITRGTTQSSATVIAKQIETKKKNGTLTPTRKEKFKWYNNGIVDLYLVENTQPSDYTLGRLLIDNTYKRRRCISPNGEIFESRRAAALAYEVVPSTIGSYISKGKSGWRWAD
jgi:hypothetical protein